MPDAAEGQGPQRRPFHRNEDGSLKSSVKGVLLTAAPILFVVAVVGLWKYGSYAMDGIAKAHENAPKVQMHSEAWSQQQIVNVKLTTVVENLAKEVNRLNRILDSGRVAARPGG